MWDIRIGFDAAPSDGRLECTADVAVRLGDKEVFFRGNWVILCHGLTVGTCITDCDKLAPYVLEVAHQIDADRIDGAEHLAPLPTGGRVKKVLVKFEALPHRG